MCEPWPTLALVNPGLLEPREQIAGERRGALVLVVEHCVTRERQERAVAALRFKTEMLWAQLEAIERGDTQPEPPA